MNKLNGFEIILIFLIGIALSLVLTFPAMWLWNYLMPMIFNLPKLTFWQTFGLQILIGCFAPHYSNYSDKK